MFRAAVIAASLRLWHASCQVRVNRCWKSQAQVPGSERVCTAAESHHGRQHAQVSRTGCTWTDQRQTSLLMLMLMHSSLLHTKSSNRVTTAAP